MISLIDAFRRKRWINVFVIYLRYLIGGAFVFSSVPKIYGERFMTQNGEMAPIDTFPHLFETLYRSGLYWEFLGWSQLVASLVLMSQVFAALGAMAFLPIILNIFVITLSYPFAGTPLVTGLMLLANIFLILWDYRKFYFLVSPNKDANLFPEEQSNVYADHRFWAFLGVVIFITSFIYVSLAGRNPMGWFLICFVEGLLGFFFMQWKFRNRSHL